MTDLSNLPLAIIVAGPTAVGKTSVAIQLAQWLDTEILSADSRQCYREMNIGTAKPDSDELALVAHYFINSHSVTEELSAFDYEQFGLDCLSKIFLKHKTAVVCGGTGLYIKALCGGLEPMPEVDAQISHEVNEVFEDKGLTWLQDSIREEDPEFYAHGERQNPSRLLRALIFKRSTGDSILKYRNAKAKERNFKILKIGLELPREELYQRIHQRVDAMMEKGLEVEARQLYSLRKYKNLNTVGYSEWFQFFEGKCSREEAISKIKQHTRNYAKRQMTWFKKDNNFHWFSPADIDEMKELIEKHL